MPGSDLLSRVLRQSTIGAGAFNGRVRNGIGFGNSAKTTRQTKNIYCKLDFINFAISSALSRHISKMFSHAFATPVIPVGPHCHNSKVLNAH